MKKPPEGGLRCAQLAHYARRQGRGKWALPAGLFTGAKELAMAQASPAILTIIPASLAFLLLLLGSPPQAQKAPDVIQTTDVRINGFQIYSGTGQITDAQTCAAIVEQNLSDAPAFGYAVGGGAFIDPVSGISVKQACKMAWPIYDNAPKHPISVAPNVYQPVSPVPCP